MALLLHNTSDIMSFLWRRSRNNKYSEWLASLWITLTKQKESRRATSRQLSDPERWKQRAFWVTLQIKSLDHLPVTQRLKGVWTYCGSHNHKGQTQTDEVDVKCNTLFFQLIILNHFLWSFPEKIDFQFKWWLIINLNHLLRSCEYAKPWNLSTGSSTYTEKVSNNKWIMNKYLKINNKERKKIPIHTKLHACRFFQETIY